MDLEWRGQASVTLALSWLFDFVSVIRYPAGDSGLAGLLPGQLETLDPPCTCVRVTSERAVADL